jgi:hypothetical protein
MSRNRTPWYEDENPDRVARGLAGRTALWIIAGVLFALVLGGGLWLFRVGTSDIKGQGDVTIKKNSAPNRIEAQEDFEELYADIQATDRKLDIYAAALKAKPDDQIARTNLDGTTAYCLGVVGDYNAKARKILAEQFRAVDLPPQIDNNDETTDCKPSKEN